MARNHVIANMTISYSEDAEGGFPVPFHVDCQFLLIKYIGTDRLDYQALFAVLKSLGGDHNPRGPHNQFLSSVDYGDVAATMGDRWWVERGEEHFVLSPVNIPQLQSYYSNLPRLHTGNQAAYYGSQALSRRDPFSLFPSEILSHIMLFLPLKSFKSFLLASRAAYNVAGTLQNHFWKLKIVYDMPFLYDLPTSTKGQDVDWKCIYKDLRQASRRGSENTILGLLNRRRVRTQILPQIAEPYATFVAKQSRQYIS